MVHLAGPDEPRVAFAISRRVGPAVVRNRLRRRLRAVWRELDPPTGDYLIVTAPPASDLAFDDLRTGLQAALLRLGASST